MSMSNRTKTLLAYIVICVSVWVVAYIAIDACFGTRNYYNHQSETKDKYSQFLIDLDPIVEMHTGLHVLIDDCVSFRVPQKDLSEMTEDELMKVLLFRNFVATSTDTDVQEWVGKMLIPQYHLNHCFIEYRIKD